MTHDTPKDLPKDPAAELPPLPPVPPVPETPPAPEAAPTPPPARSEETKRPILYGRLLVGLGVILLGMINFFPRTFPELFSLLTSGQIWRLWPVILIGFGVVKIFEAKNMKDRHGSAWLIGSGVVLLIHFLHLFGLTWGTGWPLWILAAGVIDLTFPEKSKDRPIGLFLVALGGALLIWRLDALPEGWIRAWPLLVILFGLALVWQALFNDPSRKRSARKEKDHG